MIPTFVIFLREGIEASMIVALLLAYLKRTDKREHFRDVYFGVGSAIVFMFMAGVAAYLCIHRYSGSNVQTYFETTTYLIAAGFLTYMTLWMQSHSRSMGKDLQQRSDAALSKGSRWGMRVLAFQSVIREGIETMVFTLAIIFASSRQAGTPVEGNLLWIGALLGLAVALALAYLMYHVGAKLNLRRFFQVMGTVLMVVAAGLVVDATENLQALDWLPFGKSILWDTHSWVAESSNNGDLLHSFLGYVDRPTILEASLWAAYITASLAWFLYKGRSAKKPVAAAA